MNRHTYSGLVFYLPFLLFCFSFGLHSCNSPGETLPPITTDTTTAAQNRSWNQKAIDTALSLLKNGNIVLRSGLGPDSYILKNINLKDKTYSHCGIVLFENGYPFVYHSIGGENNPDERLRRDSAQLFLTARYCAGIAIVQYNLDSENLRDLSVVVHSYYSRRPLFDLQFDLATDDKLYCAEFVYKALNTTMKDTAYIKPSWGFGRRFVGVDDLFINNHCHIVWKVAFK